MFLVGGSYAVMLYVNGSGYVIAWVLYIRKVLLCCDYLLYLDGAACKPTINQSIIRIVQ